MPITCLSLPCPGTSNILVQGRSGTGLLAVTIPKTINIIFLFVLSLITGCATVQETGAPDSVWYGVYTMEQAERGAEIYTRECETCHAANMRGGPAVRGVVGLAFQFLWKDRSLGELFEAIRTKMPPGKPGTLTDQEYIDVLAAILQGNELPAGRDTELPADPEFLGSIKITWENPGSEE